MGLGMAAFYNPLVAGAIIGGAFVASGLTALSICRDTHRAVRTWQWQQHTKLWLFTGVSVLGCGSIGDAIEPQWRDIWSFVFPLIAVIQGRAAFWTYKWLAAVQPHAKWHGGKLLILWLFAALSLRLAYQLADEEWLPVIVLGGGVGFVLCVAVTWTWLSARETSTFGSDRFRGEPLR